MNSFDQINSIVDLAKNNIDYVHVFILDGCQSAPFYTAISDRQLFPNLRSFMDLGHLYFNNCFTVFPSVTIPCHASIMTGMHPGQHGITGNNWFEPKSIKKPNLSNTINGYVKFGTRNNPGLIQKFGKANLDLTAETKTIFEAYREKNPLAKCSSIFEFINKGLPKEEIVRPSLRLFSPSLLQTAAFYLLAKVFPTEKNMQDFSLHLDEKAIQFTLEKMQIYKPEISVTWLPGMDGYSHYMGASNQLTYMQHFSKLDKYFKKLVAILNANKRLKRSLFIFTADHGQYDCKEDTTRISYRITKQDVYTHLSNSNLIDPLYLESLPIKQGNTRHQIDNQCIDYSIVVAENGGMCHLYVKQLLSAKNVDWGQPDRHGDSSYISTLESICRSFGSYRGIDQLLVRTAPEEYLQWDNSNNELIKFNPTQPYHPLSTVCTRSLAKSNRAGDIILTAQPGYYFSEEEYKGEHGTLSTVDTNVPLLIISPCLPNNPNNEINMIEDVVSTTTITPTVANILNFIENLGLPHQNEPIRNILDDERNFLLDEIAYIKKEYSLRQDFGTDKGILGDLELEEFAEPLIEDLRSAISELDSLAISDNQLKL